jgi:hypothetical protein
MASMKKAAYFTLISSTEKDKLAYPRTSVATKGRGPFVFRYTNVGCLPILVAMFSYRAKSFQAVSPVTRSPTSTVASIPAGTISEICRHPVTQFSDG